MSLESPIHPLMKEVGSILQLQEVLQSAEEASWSLEWTDGVVVACDYDAEEERVTLSGYVGEMPEQGSADLALLMLRYNALWHETGGLRLGLEEQNIVLVFDFFAPGLEMPALGHVLEDFAERARVWSRLVENHQHSASSPSFSSDHTADDISELLRSGMRA